MSEIFLNNLKNKILADDYYCLSNKTIKVNNKKVDMPLIILANHHFYFIFNLNDNIFNNDKERKRFTDEFLFIRHKFNISENMVSVFCVNETEEHLELYKYNVSDNTFLRIPDVYKSIVEDKGKYRENERIYDIYNSLCFAELKEKYVYDIFGVLYIRKNDKWLKCSEEDTDEIFDLIAFGGVFGKHKSNKKAALLYSTTCGMCGMAVLIDLLCLVFGISKDDKGFYYQPLSYSKREIFIKIILSMLMCSVVALIYGFLIVQIFNISENILINAVNNL